MTVDETVIRVVSTISGKAPAEIHPATKLSELDLDSLDRIECVLVLEEAARVEIREDDMWKLKTIQDVIDALSRVMAAQA